MDDTFCPIHGSASSSHMGSGVPSDDDDNDPSPPYHMPDPREVRLGKFYLVTVSRKVGIFSRWCMSSRLPNNRFIDLL
jgi:hypothetical protein